MGNHQGRSLLNYMMYSSYHFTLSTGIQVGSCLVKNHDRSSFEKGACDSQALAFSPAQFETLFSDQGVIALGKRFNHIVKTCLSGSLLNLCLARLWSGNKQIL